MYAYKESFAYWGAGGPALVILIGPFATELLELVQARIATPPQRVFAGKNEYEVPRLRLCTDESPLGISLPQLRRARKAISAVTFKRRGGNVISPWLWALPEHVPDDVEREEESGPEGDA